mmetsp:Transcript_67089/g.150837  ORF Transcript_67089/g.150837 Transcript_67089/m.150837 type:complete len:417 (-) Transcript_67089:92-1342(-)
MGFRPNGLPCFRKVGGVYSKALKMCYANPRLRSLLRSMPCPINGTAPTCPAGWLWGGWGVTVEGATPTWMGRSVAEACVNEMFTEDIVKRFHGALQRAAGPAHGSVLLTAVTREMVDFAENLLCSFRAVGAGTAAVILGLEKGVCKRLPRGWECVEVTSARRDPETDHWRHGAVKMTALAIAVASGFAEGVLYTSPDIVLVRNPLAVARGAAISGSGVDAIFQSNNALRQGARSCSEVHPKYWTRQGGKGMELNTGLFYIRHTPGSINFMIRALWNLYDGSTGFDGGEQRPMQHAMQELGKSFEVRTFPCGVFANGNVFWGHQEAIKLSEVALVSGNWIAGAELKRACMKAAGLWALPAPVSASSQTQAKNARTAKCSLSHEKFTTSPVALRAKAQLTDSGWILQCPTVAPPALLS